MLLGGNKGTWYVLVLLKAVPFQERMQNIAHWYICIRKWYDEENNRENDRDLTTRIDIEWHGKDNTSVPDWSFCSFYLYSIFYLLATICIQFSYFSFFKKLFFNICLTYHQEGLRIKRIYLAFNTSHLSIEVALPREKVSCFPVVIYMLYVVENIKICVKVLEYITDFPENLPPVDVSVSMLPYSYVILKAAFNLKKIYPKNEIICRTC